MNPPALSRATTMRVTSGARVPGLATSRQQLPPARHGRAEVDASRARIRDGGGTAPCPTPGLSDGRSAPVTPPLRLSAVFWGHRAAAVANGGGYACHVTLGALARFGARALAHGVARAVAHGVAHGPLPRPRVGAGHMPWWGPTTRSDIPSCAPCPALNWWKWWVGWAGWRLRSGSGRAAFSFRPVAAVRGGQQKAPAVGRRGLKDVRRGDHSPMGTRAPGA